jgi:hypothetical protein
LNFQAGFELLSNARQLASSITIYSLLLHNLSLLNRCAGWSLFSPCTVSSQLSVLGTATTLNRRFSSFKGSI